METYSYEISSYRPCDNFRIGCISLSALIPQAEAAENGIVLLEPAHRDLQGTAVDSDLLISLQPDGRLGKRVFTPEEKTA
ncbi:MAG: hypothetical protein WDO06_05125 [Actinomycetota bacterium]